jgi:hypothetical protein
MELERYEYNPIVPQLNLVNREYHACNQKRIKISPTAASLPLSYRSNNVLSVMPLLGIL